MPMGDHCIGPCASCSWPNCQSRQEWMSERAFRTCSDRNSRLVELFIRKWLFLYFVGPYPHSPSSGKCMATNDGRTIHPESSDIHQQQKQQQPQHKEGIENKLNYFIPNHAIWFPLTSLGAVIIPVKKKVLFVVDLFLYDANSYCSYHHQWMDCANATTTQPPQLMDCKLISRGHTAVNSQIALSFGAYAASTSSHLISQADRSIWGRKDNEQDGRSWLTDGSWRVVTCCIDRRRPLLQLTLPEECTSSPLSFDYT